MDALVGLLSRNSSWAIDSVVGFGRPTQKVIGDYFASVCSLIAFFERFRLECVLREVLRPFIDKLAVRRRFPVSRRLRYGLGMRLCARSSSTSKSAS